MYLGDKFWNVRRVQLFYGAAVDGVTLKSRNIGKLGLLHKNKEYKRENNVFLNL